jgi:hypothetical protein
LHIGDLDRAGEDIFRVFAEDAGAFCDALGADAVFTRLALTEEQVDLYRLPAAPPEMTGGLVVQAEALPPDVLADLVERAIRDRLDSDQFDAVAARSAAIRADFEAKLRAAGLWASRVRFSAPLLPDPPVQTGPSARRLTRPSGCTGW